MAPQTGDSARSVPVRLDVRTALMMMVGILVGFGAFAVARDATDVLTQIVIGAVLALALDGVVRSIAGRWNLSRSVAVGIVGVGLLSLAIAILLGLGPPAVEQARQFNREIPETVVEFYDLPIIGAMLERNDAVTRVEEWIDDLPAEISDDTIASTFERFVGGVLSIVIVLFTAFALLLDGEHIVQRCRRLIAPHLRDEADRIARVLHRTVGRYFGGSLTVAGLMGLYVLTIGLLFDVPLAPLAAIWAMLTGLIPQIGGFLGGAFLFVLAVSNGVPRALIVLALFVAYMNFENHFISPSIIGQAVNLSPPTTMLAAFIGGAVAGVPGALVATPLLGAAKQLYLEFRFDGERPVPAGEAAGPSARIRALARRLRGRSHRRS